MWTVRSSCTPQSQRRVRCARSSALLPVSRTPPSSPEWPSCSCQQDDREAVRSDGPQARGSGQLDAKVTLLYPQRDRGVRAATSITRFPSELAQGALRLPELGGEAFGTILADPPWRFDNRTGKVAPEHRRLARYDTMASAEIAAVPVAEAAADRSHLYLWVPNALVADGLMVMDQWGFTYKSLLLWHKVRKDGGNDGRGVGFYFRNVTELVLFGVRGSLRIRSLHGGSQGLLRTGVVERVLARERAFTLTGRHPRVWSAGRHRVVAGGRHSQGSG